jgi:hypothetical protein
MLTRSLSQPMLLDCLASRKVVADFSGGHLSSDGGLLLLRQIDLGLGLSRTLAQCFFDTRDARLVDHQLPELLAQRLHGLALGPLAAHKVHVRCRGRRPKIYSNVDATVFEIEGDCKLDLKLHDN